MRRMFPKLGKKAHTALGPSLLLIELVGPSLYAERAPRVVPCMRISFPKRRRLREEYAELCSA